MDHTFADFSIEHGDFPLVAYSYLSLPEARSPQSRIERENRCQISARMLEKMAEVPEKMSQGMVEKMKIECRNRMSKKHVRKKAVCRCRNIETTTPFFLQITMGSLEVTLILHALLNLRWVFLSYPTESLIKSDQSGSPAF